MNYPSYPQYAPQKAFLEAFCQEHALTDIPSTLPRPWPSHQTVMSWKGQDLQESYILQLSEREQNEIKTACLAYRESRKSLDQLNNSTFPLPLLAGKLDGVRHDLHFERGISLLRGLDLSSLTMREIFIIFAGLASHVSERRGRQAGGKMIAHLTDLSQGSSTNSPHSFAAPFNNQPLSFHADPRADINAMLVIDTSLTGGRALFCPVASIYNELANSRPDLLCELARPEWPFKGPKPRREQAQEMRSIHHRPILFMGKKPTPFSGTYPISVTDTDTAGPPEMVFSRGGIISASYSPLALASPRLSEADSNTSQSSTSSSLTLTQCAALDALHFAAESIALRCKYEKGDILFFNNRRILHAREGFSDDGATGRRHLLRLWLRDEELAGTPPTPLDEAWETSFGPYCHDGGEEKDDSETARWPLGPVM